MKKVLMLVLIAGLVPSFAAAKKTTYIVTNHRFNYVKLVEVNKKEISQLGITQPRELDEARMRAIFSTIKMSRRHVLNKEVDTQEVFNESSINYLSPAFVKAFREAKDNEKVIFSYLMKNPIFILRDDRLNLGAAWIHNDELHIKFDKLYAKVTGDTDAKGSEAKAIARSRGLRIDLEFAPGQQMGEKDTEELVVDLNHNFEGDAAAVAAAKPEETQKETKSKKKGKKDVAKADEAQAADAAAAGATAQADDVKTRLEKLDQLKKDKLITNKEYQEKKKEILKDL
jgi:hypothetical protein